MEAGAGDGTRTRDNLLGRQELYHLSYSRKIVFILAENPPLVKVDACLAENLTNRAVKVRIALLKELLVAV